MGREAVEIGIGNTSDEDVFAVTWHGINLGSVGLAVGAQAQDDDTSFVASLTIGGLWVVAEIEDIDASSQGAGADTSPSSIVVGYAQTLGPQTKMIYEAGVTDADTGDSDDDSTSARVVLRYDIL